MAETEISLKNTKAEILDALNQARKRADSAERSRLNPEKEEKEKREKKAVESAQKSVDQNIFSKELNEKFRDLQEAIATEESRLQELYGVNRELQKLALVLEAGRDRIAEIEAEKTEKADAAKRSLEDLRVEYQQKNAEFQAEYDTYMKKQKMERTRENEEYQYNLTRTREKENNAWADDKATREAELQKREARIAEQMADVESKTGYIRTLEEKVAEIPQLLATEKEMAISATIEELTREYEHKAALATMESKNAIVRLEDKVAYLTKELDSSGKAVGVLQGKLDKAYSEMRDLATKTVETAGGVKIISTPEKSKD